jgi:hypothetical protein
MDRVSEGEAEWSPAIWTAGHAELFARFGELSDDVAVLSEEIRGFLDASRDRSKRLVSVEHLDRVVSVVDVVDPVAARGDE